jgi:hypothetical protein
MLTQRAVLLCVVALCFYLVAVVNTLQSFYYVLVWLAVGLLGASLGIALLSLAGTTCFLRAGKAFGYSNWPRESREGDFGDGSEKEDSSGNGAPPLWEAELGNTGTLNKTGLLIDLHLRSTGGRAQASRGKELIGGRFLVEALPSGARFQAPLALGFLPRGSYSLESTRIIASDVLGLFRIARRLALPEAPLQVVVGPPIVSLALRHEAMRGAGGREGRRARAARGSDGDLRGVRPYVTGDDWRHVHWATTARTGTLAVREFEQTGRDTILVVWDGAHGSNWGQGAFSTLEAGLSLCASILVAVDAGQTPLALGVLGAETDWDQGQSESGLLPRAMIESLALARPERLCPLPQALFEVAGFQAEGFGHIFFVSASLRTDLVKAVGECVLRGHTVSVALLDGAAWMGTSGGRRASRSKGDPVQLDGERAIPVSQASYDEQGEALRRTGARVVRVAPDEGETERAALERALFSMMDN